MIESPHQVETTYEFRQRLEVAHQAGDHGLWVNRYAYLTDEKLDVIGDVAG